MYIHTLAIDRLHNKNIEKIKDFNYITYNIWKSLKEDFKNFIKKHNKLTKNLKYTSRNIQKLNSNINIVKEYDIIKKINRIYNILYSLINGNIFNKIEHELNNEIDKKLIEYYLIKIISNYEKEFTKMIDNKQCKITQKTKKFNIFVVNNDIYINRPPR